MKKNNYNTNANGPDIESVCFYDTDIAHTDFSQSFEILQHEGYRTFTKAYFIDFGNVQGADSVEFTIKGTVKELRRFLHTEGYYLESAEINRMKKQELIDEVIECLERDQAITVLSYEDLEENYFMPARGRFGVESPDYNLKIVPNKTLIKISVRGYSQGDYADVYYCPEDLESAWGKWPEQSEVQKTCERLFYDAPIYARFEINGIDYYYSEYVNDTYEWEPDNFVNRVSNDSGISVEELKKFLPEYPSYP